MRIAAGSSGSFSERKSQRFFRKKSCYCRNHGQMWKDDDGGEGNGNGTEHVF